MRLRRGSSVFSSSSTSTLAGRESLIRLIGKRRRFLPNRRSLLSTSVQSSLIRVGDQSGGIASSKVARGSSSSSKHGKVVNRSLENEEYAGGVSTSDRVTCPVCGIGVRGDDYLINSHLDACIARGTKRKVTQCTLHQLNFFVTSKDKIQCGESGDSRISVTQSGLVNNLVHSASHTSSKIGAVEENDFSHCSPSLKLESIEHAYVGDSFSDGNSCSAPLLPLENAKSKCERAVTMDDIFGVILETSIVGRRFSNIKEISPGENISLMRDPDNVKDPNAIKVLSGNSRCSKVLGFLPRELAQYLSPLIQKYCLSFEGHITSVPKDLLDAVPVQIVCKNDRSSSDDEYDDLDNFRSLWQHVLHVVESAETFVARVPKYQQNFCLLLEEVLRSNSHLLTDDEKIFLESFTSLSDDSKRLFVRLYTRKGPWFRISNISYPEISDSQKAIKGLVAMGYMSSFESADELLDDDISDVLNVLSISELRILLCTLKQKCNRGTRKQDFIASLLSSYQDGLCPLLPNVVLERIGACVRISTTADALIWRAQRLFFLNGEQDLSSFLLVDLGIIKYPTYNCILSDQIFADRCDLLAYEEAIEVAQIMDQSLDEKNSQLVLRCIDLSNSRISRPNANISQSSTSKSMTTLLSCFSASWIYSKVVLLGISFLEHKRRYKDAIYFLERLLSTFSSDRRRGYWTLRLSVDLEHLGFLEKSLSVAEDGLLDPWIRAGSRMALQRRVLRLGKPPRRWKIPSFSASVKRKITEVQIQGRPLNLTTGMKSRFYGEDGEQCGVEHLALQYYAAEGGGWQGVHSESGIWLTIFALLLWDIMFADVPNVFRNKFQNAPLDLEADCFYDMRKSIIESHLQQILDGMAEEILIRSWESHVGTACRGVNWDRHSLSELRAAVTCIGGPCLALICRHLAQDYRSWSSGMPDLLLWRFHGDYRGEAKLVEVKGPRDRLSEQQRAWLLLLMDFGFNTEVCRVSPVPVLN